MNKLEQEFFNSIDLVGGSELEIQEGDFLKLVHLLSHIHREPIATEYDFGSVDEVKANILHNCIEATTFRESEEFKRNVRRLFMQNIAVCDYGSEKV